MTYAPRRVFSRSIRSSTARVISTGDSARRRISSASSTAEVKQRAAEALGRGAVKLRLDDARVQHSTAVLDDRVARDRQPARLGIDLDLADVGPAREGQRRWIEGVCRLEPGLQPRRQLGRSEVRLLG